MNLYIILIVLSLIMMGSFFYSYLLDKWFIAPVLLLIATGMFLKFVTYQTHTNVVIPPNLLGLFGTVGLIVIVLEAAFDLRLEKENRLVLLQAFFTATLTMLASAFLIAFAFVLLYHMTFHHALVYAIPLSIVSSAIVIPSIARLGGTNVHEFLVVESIFADIVGIIFFDFILNYTTPFHSALIFSGSVALMLIISFIISIPLLLVISHTDRSNKYVFVFAVLVLVYAVSKSIHLSALILILIFGLTLNNIERILEIFKIKRVFDFEAFHLELDKLRELTEEGSFIIRTMFFVMLGFSIDFNSMFNWHVLLVGLLILGLIYGSRYLILNVTTKRSKLFLKTFVAPRGLITVLLFSQIPSDVVSQQFKTGLIFFLIVMSCIIMSTNLIVNGRSLLKKID